MDVIAKLKRLSTPGKVALAITTLVLVAGFVAIAWWCWGPRSAVGAGLGALLLAGGSGVLGRRRAPSTLAETAAELEERNRHRAEADARRAEDEADRAARDRVAARAVEAELAARRSAPDVSRRLLGGVDVPRPGGDDGADDP